MATPGCGIIFAPSQRIDRSQSLRRSRSLNPKFKHSSNKTPVTTAYNPTNAFSHGHSRTLSDKMRSLHRKKNSNDSDTSTKSATSAMSAPAPVMKQTPNQNVKHLDLNEAAAQKKRECKQAQDLARQYNGGMREVGAGKENVLQDVKLSSKPALSKMETPYRQIAYDHYLSQAFGLKGDSKSQPAAVRRLKAAQGLAPEMRPDSDMSTMTADSMEVNCHIDSEDKPSEKDRRPKIHVTIPGSQPTKRSTSSGHLVNQMNRQRTNGRSQETLTQQVSPPSSTTRQEGEAPARMSVVSPLSSVEMPKPRRPFSAFSLEEMTNDMPQDASTLEKLSQSDSSDDTADHDDRSSVYSARSSLSSLTEDTSPKKPELVQKHSVAFSIMSPAAAGVFDGMPLTPKFPHKLRGINSVSNLGVDMNKPLPPEPGMADISPLKVASYARTSSIKTRRKAPSPLNISRSSLIDVESLLPSRMSSLRSKYTPADLDALDEAFMKTSPAIHAGFYSHPETSLSQAQLELEAQLQTISEESTYQAAAPAVHDPLQISRGPNAMVPSRQAPPPSSTSAASLRSSDGSINSNRKRMIKKSSTVHVAMQMKADFKRQSRHNAMEGFLKTRMSTYLPMRGSSMKAERVLGKPPNVPSGATSAAMEREPSSESNWSSSGSPNTNYDDSSSSPTTMSREDSTTPETDVSSIPDYAFEEVRARLELLSPKNDSHYISKFGERKDSEASFFNLPLQNQSSEATPERTRPTTSEKAPVTPSVKVTPIKDEDLQLKVSIAFNEKTDASSILRRRGRACDEVRIRSLGSIAMSEIPDMYASLPSPNPTIRAEREVPMTEEEAERAISADAAEKVLLRILQNLDNLQDLFACATVSRGFYRTYKRHELPLMKNALYGMSPAAWELREMSPPYPGLEGIDNVVPKLDYTPSLYLQYYMRDMYIMVALKSMILIHCESFLRADTITALAGGEIERASQIDDAFWRVWTFCQVFGCGSNREEDIIAQMDWLRGGQLAAQQRRNKNAMDLGKDVARTSVLYCSPTSFGRGNLGGLSAEELYDMTEIWTCLGVLVRGYQGRRQEAREYGIFDNADITLGDVEKEDAVLEEWTYHLLTFAPSTVLDVSAATSPNPQTFAHARSRGYTNWTPPSVSRATFLKEAVSRVYQEKMAIRHPTSPIGSPMKATINDPTCPSTPPEMSETIAARCRVARHAAEIRAKRSDPSFKALPPSEDRPMSEFPAVIAALDPEAAPPVPRAPIHQKTPSETDTSKSFISALVVPAGPQVKDPVDVAVEKLVAMGFEQHKCEKALAETDTGNSIDFAAAMEWLVRERKRDVSCLMHATYRGPIQQQSIDSSLDQQAAIREAVGLGLGNVGMNVQ